MNTSDLIEKYIQKKATAEELEIIKQLMDRDSEFKSEVSFHLEIRKAIEKEERQKLKQRLQDLEKSKKSKQLFGTWQKIAAVLVIGLGLLWFYNQPPDLEKIYNQNFEAYPNVVAPTVRDVSTSENDVQKAFSYYDNHNYKEAVKAFETLDTEDAHFYLAMSLMADYQTEKAVEVMKNNDLQSSETYKNQTDWYLALAYLKMNDKNMAIDYLNKVIKNYPSKTEEAQKIISKIR